MIEYPDIGIPFAVLHAPWPVRQAALHAFFHPAPTFAAGENEEAMMLQSAAGDVHVPRQRRALVALTDNEVVALGLARSRFLAADTPMSLRIWSSSCPSKSMSMLLASKASPYWLRPIASSHLRISLML